MKKIKKIAASILAVAAMVTSVTGISASAATMNTYPIWLHRYVGTPSGTGTLYQSWNFTTTSNTISFDIDVFTRSTGSSYSYVTCLAYVQGVQKINSNVYVKSTTSTTVIQGRNGNASVELKDCSSGTHHVEGDFNF